MTNATGYLRRMRRSMRAGDPLVRRTDRIEARWFAALVALILLLIPCAGWTAAHSWSSQVTVAEQQLGDRITVTATLDSAPEAPAVNWGESGYLALASAPATWGWGDETRHGLAQVDGSLQAGAEVPVWVDARSGDMVSAPLTLSAAKVSSVFVGVFLWTFSTAVLCLMFSVVAWRLERHRRREWSREIDAFLGSTSSY